MWFSSAKKREQRVEEAEKEVKRAHAETQKALSELTERVSKAALNDVIKRKLIDGQ